MDKKQRWREVEESNLQYSLRDFLSFCPLAKEEEQWFKELVPRLSSCKNLLYAYGNSEGLGRLAVFLILQSKYQKRIPLPQRKVGIQTSFLLNKCYRSVQLADMWLGKVEMYGAFYENKDPLLFLIHESGGTPNKEISGVLGECINFRV